MLRSLGVLLAEGLDVVVVDLPAGDDPDSLVRRAGEAGWGIVRGSAYDAVEFVQRHVLRSARGGDPRERAIQTVVRIASGVTDPIRRRLLVERASQVFGLSEGVIARAVRQSQGGEDAARPLAAAVGAQRLRASDIEKNALRALVRAPAALQQAREQLAPEDFEDPAASALAAWLWSGEREGEPEGDAGALARELWNEGSDEMDWDAEARGAIRRLAIRRLEKLRKALNRRLATVQGDEQMRVMAEIQAVSGRLRELST